MENASSECGISTGKFLEALNFYLDSTYVEYSGSLYLQKEGVCIGSSLAPVLSDLLLASLDRQLQMALEEKSVVKTFRYVDDFLVVFKKKCGAEAEQVGELLDVFSSVLSPFSLTTEMPERGTIRFLDMSLTFCGHYVCWEYAPRSQKGFLSFSSAHTKLVKRGIVRAALKNSVLRSCHHRMFQSLQAQAERLLIAGYPRTLLLTVAESVLKSTTSKEAPQTQETRRGLINVIPHVHKVSHGLKKIAQKAGIRTVFSAPNKLGRMCKAVNDTTPPKADCSTNHATRFVPCRTNVVYEIPLECDAVRNFAYIFGCRLGPMDIRRAQALPYKYKTLYHPCVRSTLRRFLSRPG
ncbi:uncharacterized protein LOC144148269 [Haemaphysalis longicornis]